VAMSSSSCASLASVARYRCYWTYWNRRSRTYWTPCCSLQQTTLVRGGWTAGLMDDSCCPVGNSSASQTISLVSSLDASPYLSPCRLKLEFVVVRVEEAARRAGASPLGFGAPTSNGEI
jgi:hypothetical protein